MIISCYWIEVFFLIWISNYCHSVGSNPDDIFHIRPSRSSSSFIFPDKERGRGTRPSKSLTFPESSPGFFIESPDSNDTKYSGFRPSEPLNFQPTNNVPIQQSSSSDKDSVVASEEKATEIQGKVKTDVSSSLPVQSIEGKESLLTESDLFIAIEKLVERLDNFEIKLDDIEAHVISSEFDSVNVQSTIKTELEGTIVKLAERNAKLENRIQILEELLARTSPKSFANQVTITAPAISEMKEESSSEDNRDHCPQHFFSLNRLDSTSPCYHISGDIGYRKNWQQAVSNCQKIGAKLAEPQSANELKLLSNYLLTRINQIGSGYWTGGINPGLLWLWSISGNPVSNIPAELWHTPSENSSDEKEENQNCLKLSYDRTTQRYTLQGSDCQQYLYFVCEYNASHSTQRRSSDLLLKLLLQPPTANPTTTSTTTTTTTTSPLPYKPNYVGVVGFKTPTENATGHTGSNLTVFNS